MSDNFAPPPGPPPTASPQVPEGYKAHWNEQYKEWYYINIYTKKSQWEKPKEPAYPDTELSPPGPPPVYTSDKKEQPSDVQATNPSLDGTRAIVDSAPGYSQQQLPQREQKNKQGFLGKLMEKVNGGSANAGQMNGPPQYGGFPQQGYPPQSYPSQGYPPQGYPQQGYPPQGGYPPPQGYPPQGYPSQGYPPQGYPPQGGYPPPQGYPPQGYPQQGYPPQAYPPQGYPQAIGQQPKKSKASGALGMAGGAALGVGAGLVGGMLLEDAIESHDERIYEQGYQDAQDDEDFGGDDDF